jgi:hypothetical protein
VDLFNDFNTTGDPFTRYTPLISGNRAMAGCTAVAMSEIMAWHVWPLQGACKRYNSNGVLETAYISYALTNAEKSSLRSNNFTYWEAFYPNLLEYVANLLIETGYKLNQNYGIGSSYAYPPDVPDVFQQMGYTSSLCKSYTLADIQNDIDKIDGSEIPVFMAGWRNENDPYFFNHPGENGGHAYVITGTYYKDYDTPNPLGIFIKVRNGNGFGGAWWDPVTGYGQTWFNHLMFTNTNITPLYDPTLLGEIVYPYRYKCVLITNIKPNFSNAGSTNPNWIVPHNPPYPF